MRKGRPRLGQNFLTSAAVVHRIVDALGVSAGETVVEVGPGRGALTKPLLVKGVRVVAFELDDALAAKLEAECSGAGFFLHRADAREADVASALTAAGVSPPVPFVSNLPYESATPLIRGFVKSGLFSRLVVMVQKEVGQRLAARPGDDAYGFLSLDVGAYAKARLLFDVAPGSFTPRPRVWSSVLRLEPHPAEPGTPDALAIASTAFLTRRKTLLNGLTARYGREETRAAIAALGLLETVRAEELGLDVFRQLGAVLKPLAATPG